jgi:hypothetical protein
MALADLKLPPIKFIRAKTYTEGRSEPVRAFVNHRMVGYLAGTDAYFQNPDRPVSTHFGIGYGSDGVVKVHQYVPLDDTAFGNGNYDPSGRWDDWGFKTTEVNPQTISIEHQDHGDAKGKGVVSEKTQLASIKLQALIRYGTMAEWKAAGLVLRDWNNYAVLRKELNAVPIDYKHVINHNDIAGKLKPYCWKPWASDTVGFDNAKYITGIKNWGKILDEGYPAPTPPPAPTYTEAQLQAAVAQAISTSTAEIATLKTQLAEAKAATLLVKQELKSKIIAFVQSQ